MRIDKVKHREISSRTIQRRVNILARQGLRKEEIEKTLLYVQGQATEGDNTYGITLPAVSVERSHLGRGFITFFICPYCRKKVKVVYVLVSKMACRVCHGLTYKKQDRRQIEIHRLIWDTQLAERYMATGRWQYIRKAMEAEFARDEIKSKGYMIASALMKEVK